LSFTLPVLALSIQVPLDIFWNLIISYLSNCLFKTSFDRIGDLIYLFDHAMAAELTSCAKVCCMQWRDLTKE
jgi:hypothetical protein